MKIRDVMTKDVHLARPADTIQEVAGRMAKGGFGFVPVADGDQFALSRDLAIGPDRVRMLRGLLVITFCSMAMAGLMPLMRSTSGFSRRPRNWRA